MEENTKDKVRFPGETSPSGANMRSPPSPAPARHRELFAPARHPSNSSSKDLMGPILRRKKVVSMPLGMGGDFFVGGGAGAGVVDAVDLGGPHRQLLMEGGGGGPAAHSRSQRIRQMSHQEHPRRERQITPTGLVPTGITPPQSPGSAHRRRQGSFVKGLIRRKQVSLDLLGPNDFFVTSEQIEVEPLLEEEEHLPTTIEGKVLVDIDEEGREKARQEDAEAAEQKRLQNEAKKLFLPLRFAPPAAHPKTAAAASTEQQPATYSNHPVIDEEATQALEQLVSHGNDLKLHISSLQNKIEEEEGDTERKSHLLSVNSSMHKTFEKMEETQKRIQEKFLPSTTTTATEDAPPSTADSIAQDIAEDHNIIRATKDDKIKMGVIAFIMLIFTIAMCTWETHVDSEIFIHSPVGLACVTDCAGNVETRDFFNGHNHFNTDEVIEFHVNVDPHPEATDDSELLIEIVGEETQHVKKTLTIGPVDDDERKTFTEKVTVDFDEPHEHHFINVKSTDSNLQASFTLLASVQKPLSDNSVLVAALIMIAVYFFILIEVIHRTLVAIFGSMLALLFYFIMSGGETESIQQIMLHLEWSTLGLLFGMMLIVGELSHTGVFEWCAVRLLVASKGSFARLLVLLCSLTAVASAFLDNVTTMLLVAPVTIDMCSILQVDPRPYLIGEIILSNVGGTATLIGDPPNIIIGSSFEEIGFVDFIFHVLPAIFVFAVPAALLLIVWVYRWYLTSTKMRELDTAELKRTYPIYDEPRLMVAGTVTAFVIVIFFLHSVHHKDTAWVALFGAFITISFTNPHDVQDALRNHVEWDTLLFFAGLFILVEVCAAMGLLDAIGKELASMIESQPEEKQLPVAITLVMWVSAIVSAFLDNIPYTATMIPVIGILTDELPNLDLTTMAWALSFGACLGGNGTLLGASANIVTAGIATNKGYDISFLNFLYPGMLAMVVTVAICNIYMLVRYAWI